jgi:hypothetical protein
MLAGRALRASLCSSRFIEGKRFYFGRRRKNKIVAFLTLGLTDTTDETRDG